MASTQHQLLQAVEWKPLNSHLDAEPHENLDHIPLSTFRKSTSGAVLETGQIEAHRSTHRNHVTARDILDTFLLQEWPLERGRRTISDFFPKRPRSKSQVKCYRKRGILRSIRAVFVWLKMYLVMYYILEDASFVMNLTWASVLGLWDVVHFLDSRWNAFQLGFEIKTIFESVSVLVLLTAVCIDIYGAVKLEEVAYYRYAQPLEELQAVAAFSILLTCFVLGITGRFAYRLVKDYPTNRRLYNKSKPSIVFTPNGDANAVFTYLPLALETTRERQSTDSLLQQSEQNSEEESSQRASYFV